MTEQHNIHENFLEQARTHAQRERLALELLKTPGEINSLTAYHDFRRLKSINKHLAKIYIIAGIRGISHLKKLSVSQIQQKIKNSRVGNTTRVDSSVISQSISEAKLSEILVSGLEKEKFFLQRKGYIFSKSPVSSEEAVNSGNKNIDLKLLVIILSIISLCSLVSPYFLALIPVIVSLHILLESKCTQYISTLLRKIGISLGWEKTIVASMLSIFSLVFALGWFSGTLQSDVQRAFYSSPVLEDRYFPSEIYSYYQESPISREDLIKILTVSTGVNMDEHEEIECFADSFQSRYPRELCYAKEMGYVQGDDFGKFYPSQEISHAAGLKFILNFYKYNVPQRSLYLSYTDLDKNQWQTSYAEYAKGMGLIDKSVTEFHPNATITIEQVGRYLSILTERRK